jgi:putative transposase
LSNNYQSGVLDSHAAGRLALPETVSVALEEIATDMQEGLLALAVGAGLQVMQQLMEADVAARPSFPVDGEVTNMVTNCGD